MGSFQIAAATGNAANVRWRGGGGIRRNELGVGQFAQNQPGSLQKNGRHIVDFADAAARQYREHGAVFVQFQAEARAAAFVGLHGQCLRQQVPHKQRVAAFLTVQFWLHRKQAAPD